jgi:hypothetical protein
VSTFPGSSTVVVILGGPGMMLVNVGYMHIQTL